MEADIGILLANDSSGAAAGSAVPTKPHKTKAQAALASSDALGHSLLNW